MPYIFSFGIVLHDVILTIPVYHIDISIGRIYCGLSGYELTGKFIFSGFFWIIQFKYFLPLQVRLDHLVAAGIRKEKKLLITFCAKRQSMATRIAVAPSFQ